MLGGQHPAAEPVHGRFKREAGARRRLIEQAGQDPVLIIQRARRGPQCAPSDATRSNSSISSGTVNCCDSTTCFNVMRGMS